MHVCIAYLFFFFFSKKEKKKKQKKERLGFRLKSDKREE